MKYPFAPNQAFCVMDFETFSEVDIEDAGAYEYAIHPSTEILCAAWAVGPIEAVGLYGIPSASGEDFASEDWELFIEALDDVVIVAHNAGFDRLILQHVFLRKLKEQKLGFSATKIESIPPEAWMCSASLARASGLPGKLEEAAKALKLPNLKDMAGSEIAKKFWCPRKPTKADPSTRYNNFEEFLRVISYCETDVKATCDLIRAVPMLTPTERQAWLLDQKINDTGFPVDRKLVHNVQRLVEIEKPRIDRRVSDISEGALSSIGQAAAMTTWCRTQGVDIPNLQKETVRDFLEQELPPLVRDMLTLRQVGAKSSISKLEAFRARTQSSDRVRDTLIYHGAAPGRWTGRGPQPQNLPKRPKTISVQTVLDSIDLIRERGAEDDPEELNSLIEVLYGAPLPLYSAILRASIQASPGYVLDQADFASIEPRVLFWVAGHTEGLNAYIEGRDLYRELARRIFKLNLVEQVTSAQREFGKKVVLGCGYQMGVDTFYQSCVKEGLKWVTIDLAKEAVYGYRSEHAKVPELWNNVQQMAQAAVASPGRAFARGPITYVVEGGVLKCYLPSGRAISYRQPRLKQEVNKFGYESVNLYAMKPMNQGGAFALNSYYGGILVENLVQGIARDLLVHSMLELEKQKDWRLILTVHDEVLSERKKGTRSFEEFKKIMTTAPAWAAGLPVDAGGFTGDRYMKA